MKPEELRKGNIITTTLSRDRSRPMIVTAVSGIGASFNTGKYDIAWVELDRLKPVKITPKILENAGIHKFSNRDDEYCIIQNDEMELSYCFDVKQFALLLVGNSNSAAQFDNIKYVHQLQNLYYALTGEELIIKLNELQQA